MCREGGQPVALKAWVVSGFLTSQVFFQCSKKEFVASVRSLQGHNVTKQSRQEPRVWNRARTWAFCFGNE